MEWKLDDVSMQDYQKLLKQAQDLEWNIGSSMVRVNKLIKMRDDIDGALKGWWDVVLKNMNLDPKKDYSISMEGTITDVTLEPAPKPESRTGTNADSLV